MMKNKMKIFPVLLIFFGSLISAEPFPGHPFGLNSQTACYVKFDIYDSGWIVGTTDSQDLLEGSNYKDFKIFDDDGFITQLIVFNRIFSQFKEEMKISNEDLEFLYQGTERALKYSSDKKNLNNPRLKPDDRDNLLYTNYFNTYFKKQLDQVKLKNNMLQTEPFIVWKNYMEGQRYNHFYTIHGLSHQPPQRGIINLGGRFPKLIPECCRLTIAELNNIMAMSLFNKDFLFRSKPIAGMYRTTESKCTAGYEISYQLKKGLPADI